MIDFSNENELEQLVDEGSDPLEILLRLEEEGEHIEMWFD